MPPGYANNRYWKGEEKRMAEELQVYKYVGCGNVVEVIADGKAYRQFLQPGQAPEAVFSLAVENVMVREHCNLHGLWEAK
jgi:desulfoferrodoxin-like iron-binding protein